MASPTDEQTAQSIARAVREIRDQTEEYSQSTYIPAYITEYIDDTASIIRRLRASQNSSTATTSMVHTLQWRENNKVYPTRRSTHTQDLVVDKQGLLVVRSRQASLLPQLTGKGKRRLDGRSIEALEDARMALKAVYMQSGNISQAAIVVAIESVSLAELTADVIRNVARVAHTHYPGTVARVYITAASSVLLEHARQALQPMIRRIGSSTLQSIIVFELDSVLAAHTTTLAEFAACVQHARADAAYAPLRRLDELMTRRTNSCSDMDADEFHSARSTHTAHDDEVEESRAMPVQLASLQRAVQGVQSMLRSVNDSVVGDDSWMALATAKSRLSQQADVLMSTVAALNAGLSMLGGQLVVGNESARAHAFVGMVKEPARPHPSSLQMLALPVALLFGRPNDAIRMLWAQLLRAVRRIVRRLPSLNMLLLLAYKRFRIHAMILWAGALLAWQANAALIWSNLRLSWQRGISF
ncbi:hypothetical protein EV180_002377 [Coemansia sp. RSA 518]|nr:hypothetical protein IW142_000634 [Coemansia sp. RSA 564]KAJ2195861.1 hypothetical protein IW144_003237 [Coemansia sp. RSA 522]KAJ2227620.1 hypothetical protein EV180_002377 [Coemansia sp. RSA 518]KAJ2242079.1 hypothetical protein GGH97_004061 [Coemansia sp. RSA 475]KAJ2279514.1 hypothetical protein EV176_001469 [Coemansia sp. RSA 451]